MRGSVEPESEGQGEEGGGFERVVKDSDINAQIIYSLEGFISHSCSR